MFVYISNVIIIGNITLTMIIPLVANKELRKNLWWMVYVCFSDKRKKSHLREKEKQLKDQEKIGLCIQHSWSTKKDNKKR